MTINENTIKGKWLELRGDIQKACVLSQKKKV